MGFNPGFKGLKMFDHTSAHIATKLEHTIVHCSTEQPEKYPRREACAYGNTICGRMNGTDMNYLQLVPALQFRDAQSAESALKTEVLRTCQLFGPVAWDIGVTACNIKPWISDETA